MPRHSKEQREAAAILDSKHRLRRGQSFVEGTRAEIEAQKATAAERQRLERESK